jgi:hypothetical protein
MITITIVESEIAGGAGVPAEREHPVVWAMPRVPVAWLVGAREHLSTAAEDRRRGVARQAIYSQACRD